MTERRILALLAFLLGIVAFAFVLLRAIEFGRNPSLTAEFLLSRFVDVVLAIAILLGSVMIYRGTYAGGGIINLVLGVIVLVWTGDWQTAILAIISGVLGLAASEARR